MAFHCRYRTSVQLGPRLRRGKGGATTNLVVDEPLEEEHFVDGPVVAVERHDAGEAGAQGLRRQVGETRRQAAQQVGRQQRHVAVVDEPAQAAAVGQQSVDAHAPVRRRLDVEAGVKVAHRRPASHPFRRRRRAVRLSGRKTSIPNVTA